MSGYNYLNFSKQIYQGLKEEVFSSLDQSCRQKDKIVHDPNLINPEFRLLVSDLAYFLTVHKQILDVLEKEVGLIPYEIRDRARDRVLKKYAQKMYDGIYYYSTSMEDVCKDLSAEDHVCYKSYFQGHLLEIFTHSCDFTRRSYSKPNGYAGDYVLMNMICEDSPYLGKSLYEQCVQYFTVNSPSAIPVKNRLEIIDEELQKTVSILKSKKDLIRIFDVACGPSISIQRFLTQEESNLLEVSFLDHDHEAIGYLQNRLRNLKEVYQRKTSFRFINANVKDAFSNPENLQRLLGQDFIFSSGLFDYLDETQALMLSNMLYSLLAPGGVLLIGNLCSESKGKIFQWYINDWPIFFRSREEMLSIAPSEAKVEVLAEKTGANLFLKITKPEIF